MQDLPCGRHLRRRRRVHVAHGGRGVDQGRERVHPELVPGGPREDERGRARPGAVRGVQRGGPPGGGQDGPERREVRVRLGALPAGRRVCALPFRHVQERHRGRHRVHELHSGRLHRQRGRDIRGGVRVHRGEHRDAQRHVPVQGWGGGAPPDRVRAVPGRRVQKLHGKPDVRVLHAERPPGEHDGRAGEHQRERLPLQIGERGDRRQPVPVQRRRGRERHHGRVRAVSVRPVQERRRERRLCRLPRRRLHGARGCARARRVRVRVALLRGSRRGLRVRGGRGRRRPRPRPRGAVQPMRLSLIQELHREQRLRPVPDRGHHGADRRPQPDGVRVHLVQRRVWARRELPVPRRFGRLRHRPQPVLRPVRRRVLQGRHEQHRLRKVHRRGHHRQRGERARRGLPVQGEHRRPGGGAGQVRVPVRRGRAGHRRQRGRLHAVRPRILQGDQRRRQLRAVSGRVLIDSPGGAERVGVHLQGPQLADERRTGQPGVQVRGGGGRRRAGHRGCGGGAVPAVS
mmetsp:Transcript_12013/g.25245  ORF Transcript_12013/g.25245 Transcript_12013/m.25245 type:complete len:515 (-) Transcript_12013:1157-2701(-)